MNPFVQPQTGLKDTLDVRGVDPVGLLIQSLEAGTGWGRIDKGFSVNGPICGFSSGRTETFSRGFGSRSWKICASPERTSVCDSAGGLTRRINPATGRTERIGRKHIMEPVFHIPFPESSGLHPIQPLAKVIMRAWRPYERASCTAVPGCTK